MNAMFIGKCLITLLQVLRGNFFGLLYFFFLYLCDIDDTVLFACFSILMMELLTTDTLSEVKSPISGPGSRL